MDPILWKPCVTLRKRHGGLSQGASREKAPTAWTKFSRKTSFYFRHKPMYIRIWQDPASRCDANCREDVPKNALIVSLTVPFSVHAAPHSDHIYKHDTGKRDEKCCFAFSPLTVILFIQPDAYSSPQPPSSLCRVTIPTPRTRLVSPRPRQRR